MNFHVIYGFSLPTKRSKFTSRAENALLVPPCNQRISTPGTIRKGHEERWRCLHLARWSFLPGPLVGLPIRSHVQPIGSWMMDVSFGYRASLFHGFFTQRKWVDHQYFKFLYFDPSFNSFKASFSDIPFRLIHEKKGLVEVGYDMFFLVSTPCFWLGIFVNKDVDGNGYCKRISKKSSPFWPWLLPGFGITIHNLTNRFVLAKEQWETRRSRHHCPAAASRKCCIRTWIVFHFCQEVSCEQRSSFLQLSNYDAKGIPCLQSWGTLSRFLLNHLFCESRLEPHLCVTVGLSQEKWWAF